jgi:transcriptional regulator with XRE-family HTH domain
VRRWQLSEALRQARERVGLSHEEVVAAIGKNRGNWSPPKLSRIENRVHRVKEQELDTLLDVYQVDEPAARSWLHELRGHVTERGYWEAYRRDLPKGFHKVLDVEAAVVSCRQFETMLVPGLLQTSDYTRALVEGIDPSLPANVVERRVIARMARQQVLTRPEPLRLHVILDEGILERQVGSITVWRNQLRRLIDESTHEHITIQLLPKSAGATPALEGPFAVMTLPEPIPDLGYTEGSGRSSYVDDHDTVRDFTLRFATLTRKALPAARSVQRIAEAVRPYR